MPKVSIQKSINASPEEVWNFISDIETAPEWVLVMQSLVETTDNPVKAGTVYRERSKIGPKESETTWRVSRFEAPHLQVHECQESDFAATLTMRVEPMGEHSILHHTTEYQLMPTFRPLGWLLENLIVRREMERNLNESVERCKQMIES